MTTTILQTNNQAWGFWGAIGDHAEQSKAWARAMTAIGTATRCEADAVRDFLDSRHGRHFADDVANERFAGMTIPDAIDAAVKRWMTWRISKRAEREYGIPRGLPYLTGWVMNCEIEAEITG